MKGSDGVFGVLPGHVPTISQLQPGTVSVEYEEDGVTQVRVYCRTIPVLVARVLADLAEIHRCCAAQSKDFFVCGGFAYIKSNSDVDVCAVEACAAEDIDITVRCLWSATTIRYLLCDQ